MSWFEWYQGEMMKSVGQKWQNPILSLLHFLYKYYVTFLTFMMFQNLSGVNEFDVCWKIWLICKYYVTFFTFMIIQMLSGVNDFDVCCKIGCLCKYYVTFFTFSIIQKLCCEWHWCVLQDRMHLQILCNIFHIQYHSKALLWMVLLCFAR